MLQEVTGKDVADLLPEKNTDRTSQRAKHDILPGQFVSVLMSILVDGSPQATSA